jgi:hypothetical protein
MSSADTIPQRVARDAFFNTLIYGVLTALTVAFCPHLGWFGLAIMYALCGLFCVSVLNTIFVLMLGLILKIRNRLRRQPQESSAWQKAEAIRLIEAAIDAGFTWFLWRSIPHSPVSL